MKRTDSTSKTALGFFYVARDERHAEVIYDSVDSNGDFSDGVLASRVAVEKVDLVLVFITTGEQEVVKYAALGTRHLRGGGGTGKQGVRLTDMVVLDLSLDRVKDNVGGETRNQLGSLLKWDADRPSPAVWDAIWQSVKDMASDEQRVHLEKLERRRLAPVFDFQLDGADLAYCQKDAVGVALDIAGIDRREVFAGLSEGLSEGKTLLRSVSGSLKERVVIDHDVTKMPGFVREFDGGDHCVFRQGNKRLTVYNIDFSSGEIALGCDLIYYNHFFESFTFVQYKLMDREGDSFGYRPDRQCKDEVDRMNSLIDFIAKKKSNDLGLKSFRLVGNPFFFKLCKRDRLLIDMPELTRGMYLNLDYWELLCKDESTQGPRGGTKITFEAAGRWLCRTDFAPMVADGWVGTRGLTEIELSDWVEEASKERRNVIYAKSSGIKGS